MTISIREPGSAITHFIAMIMAMGSAIPLLIKASSLGTIYTIAMFIFISRQDDHPVCDLRRE